MEKGRLTDDLKVGSTQKLTSVKGWRRSACSAKVARGSHYQFRVAMQCPEQSSPLLFPAKARLKCGVAGRTIMREHCPVGCLHGTYSAFTILVVIADQVGKRGRLMQVGLYRGTLSAWHSILSTTIRRLRQRGN